ncbi:MAG: NAD-dependent epimerase/dehydratase family protein [Proteobacteria bacterium]|nr:NAD-dependent epimerase/dehydratase family protein [Pseudomonadota bacterium]
MKYIVTGGAGFIGSHLTEELLNIGHSVCVYDNLSSGYESNLPIHESLAFIRKRIQDVNLQEIGNLDGIFHFGAQASVPISIEEFYESSNNNLASSLKVFEIAKNYAIPVVYASSSAIYGNLPIGDDERPIYEILSPYAQDKLVLEQYAKLFFELYQISSIGLRFFNVYGPKQDPANPYSGVISVFIDKFLNKLPVTINGGYQTRDFVYVKDIVKTLIRSMDLAKSNKVCEFINVGTGLSTTVDELYQKLCNIFNFKPDVIYKPLPLGDPEKSSGIFNKLDQLLQIDQAEFYSLDYGLKHTVEYFKDINNEKI